MDGYNYTYRNNLVVNNTGPGIAHEISWAAVVENNTLCFNGEDQFTWIWGGQVQVQNSRDVIVRGNTAVVSAAFGNGIGMIFQDRGNGWTPLLLACLHGRVECSQFLLKAKADPKAAKPKADPKAKAASGPKATQNPSWFEDLPPLAEAPEWKGTDSPPDFDIAHHLPAGHQRSITNGKIAGLKKKPSTSELLDWLKLLLAEDIPPDALRAADGQKSMPPLAGALLKNEQDMTLFERLIYMNRHNR